jgi:hypothetical protein
MKFEKEREKLYRKDFIKKMKQESKNMLSYKLTETEESSFSRSDVSLVCVCLVSFTLLFSVE